MAIEEEFLRNLAAESERSHTTNIISLDEKHSADFYHKHHGSNVVGEKRNALQQDPAQPDDVCYQYLTFQTEVATVPVWVNDTSPVNDQDIPSMPPLEQYSDPFTWSRTRKNWMTCLACSATSVSAWAAGSYALPADILTAKWHVSYVVYNLGISFFAFSFGIAPMVLAPFSEINGRRPMFISSGLLFVICQLCCALTPSFGGMLASRFFLGVGGSTFNTMVGGILADIWVAADRNTPMVVFTGATLCGNGLGPMISGFIVQNLDWPWVFYVQAIASGAMMILVTIFFKETRGSVILSRKAKILNKYYEQLEKMGAVGVLVPHSELHLVSDDTSTPLAPKNDHVQPSITPVAHSKNATRVRHLRYRVKSDEERASLLKMISLSLYRAVHMLVTEPVVFWFALWMAFSWAILFLQFGSVPLIFQTTYNFTTEQTGAAFAAIPIGSILSTAISIYQERWALKHRPDLARSPEGRLYYACVQSVLMPIGLFWFGWSCYPHVHWIMPAIGVVLATMGIFSIFLAVFNYMADVYQTYASSALAGIGMARNLLGGCFPLITKQMFEGMGYHAAGSLLGAIGAILTCVPAILVFYGPRIRRRSRIARAFVETDEEAERENDSSTTYRGKVK